MAGFWTMLDEEELVVCWATHSVQIVLVLVLKIVETLVVFTMAVVPFATLVLVTGQLVRVVWTISVVNAATVDIGDAVELVIAGDAIKSVVCGAKHLVQMVLVLVLKMVDTLVVLSMDVVPFETLVLVTGQLVTVV